MNKNITTIITIPALILLMAAAPALHADDVRRQLYLEQTLKIANPEGAIPYAFLTPAPEDANWHIWQRRTGELPPDFSEMESIYDLPDPLVMDGHPITTIEQWNQKRAWIKEQFQRWAGGHAPPAPTRFESEILEDHFENGVRLQTIEMRFGPQNRAKMTIELMIPPGEGPFPVYMTQWNHRNWAQLALRRGYLACRYAAADLKDDTIYYPQMYPDYDFSGLMRRAWGASRVIDYLYARSEVDRSKIAITGHSRNGKQSLWAAAFDERITACLTSSCGTGGMTPFRYTDPQYCTETIDRIMCHDWFLPRLRYFFGREHKLPIDQNLLLSLIAPRPLLLHYAYTERAFSPWGSERCYDSVRRVYSFLGAETQIGHFSRMGEHAVATRDLERCLDFLDMQFGRRDVGWVNNRLYNMSFEKWRATHGKKFVPGSIEPVYLAPNQTPGSFGTQKKIIQNTLLRLFGEKPAGVQSDTIAPVLPNKVDWIENTVRRPEVANAKHIYLGPTTAARDHLGMHLYYPKKTNIESDKTRLPVIIYLHAYAYNTGFSNGHRAINTTATTALFQDFINNGFAVIAFDMIGFGTRMDEGHYFYERFPRWSKMGKMVDDVVASIDAIGMLPCLDKNKIFLVGNTIGGNVALLTAALDERVAGVAVTAAFTPWRDESFPHGFETIADSHCFLPQLGCWRGRQKDIPIDYTEILPCIAPRPMLIIAPTLDWHANHDAVKQTVGQAQCIYDLYNRTANLQFETTEEINRLTKDMQKTLMKSLCKWRDRPHAAKVVGQCLEPAGLGTTK